MKNAGIKKIVPSAKTLINTIVSSDDIKAAAKKMNKEPIFIRNVLNGNNKRDEKRVLKILKSSIKKRIAKEEKILETIEI